MKKQPITFITNCLLLIFLVFISDQVIGRALRHFYFKSESGEIYQLRYSLDSTKAEIIILGSSRANHHYVPEVIEQEVDMTCFNTGVDANFMLNSCAIYKSIVHRYHPRVVLLDLSLNELLSGTGGYDELSSLLPYFRSKEEIRDIVLMKSKFERQKLISEIYPFNSASLAIAEGNVLKNNIIEPNGYLPLYGNIKDTILRFDQHKEHMLDRNKIFVLSQIASDCKQRDIRLILIQSPRYIIANQYKIASVLDSLEVLYNLEFWDYSNAPMFLNSKYFNDQEHLNDLGAHEFTKIVTQRLLE